MKDSSHQVERLTTVKSCHATTGPPGPVMAAAGGPPGPLVALSVTLIGPGGPRMAP